MQNVNENMRRAIGLPLSSMIILNRYKVNLVMLFLKINLKTGRE